MSHCATWTSNPTVNPASGLKIKKNGELYNIYHKMCADNEALLLKWSLNKTVNPITNRKIMKNGDTYRMFEDILDARTGRRNASPARSRVLSPSFSACAKWIVDKSRNPLTGRPISKHGDIYRRFSKTCENIELPGRPRKRSPPKYERIPLSDPRFCTTWLSNKSVNPATGKKLEPQSNKSKRFAKKCSGDRKARSASPKKRSRSTSRSPSPKRARSPRYEKISLKDPRFCATWLSNKSVNPATGKKLESTSNQSKRFAKKCSSMKKSSKGKYTSPSVVPTRSTEASWSSRGSSPSRSRSPSPMRSMSPRQTLAPAKSVRLAKRLEADEEGYWRGGGRASEWDDVLRY